MTFGMPLWPDERIETLKKLHAEGYSGHIIGERLGVSRSAVLGKINRLGLSEPQVKKPVMRAGKELPPKGSASFRRSSASHDMMVSRILTDVSRRKHSIRCVEVVSRNLSLLDLEKNDCRYPTSEGDAHLFCGNPKLPDSSYCGPHTALAWVPANKSFGATRKYFGTDFAA